MTLLSEYLVRFTAVGIGSNAVLYLLYLVLTWLGMGHKSAMSGLFVLGMVQTFLLNKIWTFAHRGSMSTVIGRYFLAYALGYLLNLLVLIFFVDELGLPHQLMQGLAIPLVAVIVFLIQRHWVFSHRKT
jgi:putative flippase GtrA